jgi:hypothetical protein
MPAAILVFLLGMITVFFLLIKSNTFSFSYLSIAVGIQIRFSSILILLSIIGLNNKKISKEAYLSAKLSSKQINLKRERKDVSCLLQI